MSNLNVVALTGRIVRDPEIKYTDGGTAVASTSIAVNRFTKKEDGDYEVDFFPLVLWKKTAEFAAQYLGKGRLVSIKGRLQQRSWVTNEGQKRSITEIVVESIQPEGPRPEGSESEDAARYKASAAERVVNTPTAPTDLPSGPDDDADPFGDE